MGSNRTPDDITQVMGGAAPDAASNFWATWCGPCRAENGGWIIGYIRKDLLERSLGKANIQTIKMQIVAGILFTLAVAFG